MNFGLPSRAQISNLLNKRRQFTVKVHRVRLKVSVIILPPMHLQKELCATGVGNPATRSIFVSNLRLVRIKLISVRKGRIIIGMKRRRVIRKILMRISQRAQSVRRKDIRIICVSRRPKTNLNVHLHGPPALLR